ncbi:hypothetical protein [Paenibacillus lautus]|uniref:hypothetical protein n=1 Tax=Paenibacillus lautus TaxID=1401 RepID=UPI003985D772
MREQNKIDEIKEALAAATPGPWEVRETRDYTAIFSSKEGLTSVVAANTLPRTSEKIITNC